MEKDFRLIEEAKDHLMSGVSCCEADRHRIQSALDSILSPVHKSTTDVEGISVIPKAYRRGNITLVVSTLIRAPVIDVTAQYATTMMSEVRKKVSAGKTLLTDKTELLKLSKGGCETVVYKEYNVLGAKCSSVSRIITAYDQERNTGIRIEYPIDYDSAPDLNEADVMRGETNATFLFRPADSNCTEMSGKIQIQLNFGGMVSRRDSLLKKLFPLRLRNAIQLEKDLVYLRVKNFDDGSSRDFGTSIAKEILSSQQSVSESFFNYVMKSLVLGKKEPSMHWLLYGIAVNKLGALANSSNKSWDVISRSEAFKIGKSFKVFLVSIDTVEEVINKWTNFYPCVGELMSDSPWLKQLIFGMITTLDNHERTTNLSGLNTFVLYTGLDVSKQHLDFDLDKNSDSFLTFAQPFLGMTWNYEFIAAVTLPYVLVAAIFSMPSGNGLHKQSEEDGDSRGIFFVCVLVPLQLLPAAWLEGAYIFTMLRGQVVMRNIASKKKSLFLLEVFGWNTFLLGLLTCSYWYQVLSWAFPIPWMLIQAPCWILPLIPIVISRMKEVGERKHIESMSNKYLLRVFSVTSFVFLPAAIFIPLSTSLYVTFDGYKQLLVIVGLIGFRFGLVFANETLSVGHLCDFAPITMNFIIDMLFENQAAMLGANADLTITLALPPISDFFGNMVSLIWLLKYCKDSREQTLLLTSLCLRELVEIMASAGVMLVYFICYTRQNDFYAIDTISQGNLQKALTMSAIDFACECVVLFIITKLVKTVFGVGVVELSQATVRALSSEVVFVLVAGTLAFQFAFLEYSTGSDYFFNFVWMRENTPEGWCETLQDLGKSCYGHNADFDTLITSMMNTSSAASPSGVASP